jgi:hypothetical protein
VNSCSELIEHFLLIYGSFAGQDSLDCLAENDVEIKMSGDLNESRL